MLQVSNVESILYASNGDLWVGSNKGLFRRKAGGRTFDCEKNMDIKSVIEDREGQIWIGTWEQGLLRYNPQEELYYTYEGINPGNSAHVIFQDEAGNIWIGTWRYGLVKLINPYDPEHFSFKTFRNIKGNSHSLLDNIIYAIAQDKIPESSGSVHAVESVFWKMNRGTGILPILFRATFKEIYLLMK